MDCWDDLSWYERRWQPARKSLYSASRHVRCSAHFLKHFASVLISTETPAEHYQLGQKARSSQSWVSSLKIAAPQLTLYELAQHDLSRENILIENWLLKQDWYVRYRGRLCSNIRNNLATFKTFPHFLRQGGYATPGVCWFVGLLAGLHKKVTGGVGCNFQRRLHLTQLRGG